MDSDPWKIKAVSTSDSNTSIAARWNIHTCEAAAIVTSIKTCHFLNPTAISVGNKNKIEDSVRQSF